MSSSAVVETSTHANGSVDRFAMKGAQLHIARTLWAIIAVTSLGLFILSLPYHIIYISSYMPFDLRVALMQLGISPNFYIGYQLVHDLIIVLGFSIIGVAIFRHKSDDRMTLFISLALITFGVTITSLES